LIEENRKANSGKCKVAEVAKAISERWAKMGADEKAKYEEQAKEGKEGKAAEMKAYKDAKDPLGALKEKYADLIPKKPMGAYWIFAQDEAEKSKAEKALKDAGEEPSTKKTATKLGELWKGISEKEKAPWNEKAKKAVLEYEKKRKIWEARPEYVEFQKVENEQKEAAKEEKAKEKAADKEAKIAAKEAEKEEKTREKAAAKDAKKDGSPKKNPLKSERQQMNHRRKPRKLKSRSPQRLESWPSPRLQSLTQMS